MNIIVQSTNKGTTDIYTGLNKLDDLHLLDMAEAKAFLGLLIVIGVLKGRREPLEQLWDDKWSRAVLVENSKLIIKNYKLLHSI